MDMVETKAATVAEAYLELLALRGIEYFFGNAGTDFASIIDAFACRQEQGKSIPRPLSIPHEIPLVGMAHGYYLATGRPQVAMVHVGIGTANGLGALMGAYRARVPILFSAGRTPITEEGSPASRSRPIHWAQDAFDQAGMLREYVKWDYELRTPFQLESVVDRALAMAMSEPKGPIYLTLPREILATPLEEVEFQAQPRYDLPTYHPDPAKVQEAARILCEAKYPLIITSSAGRSHSAVQALMDLADMGAIGVVSFNPEYMNFPTDHPCHLGFFPDPYFSEADVLLVVDCDVPWFTNINKPRESTFIIQAGIDPLYSDYPIRSFPSDLTLQGNPALIFSGLKQAISEGSHRNEDTITSRRERLQEVHDDLVRGWQESAQEKASDRPIDPRWISQSVNRILGEDGILVNEYDNSMKEYVGQRPGSYFGSPHAGYLGWGLGAALGIKLARPEQTVVATVGDGCYMFAVPSACHFASEAYQIPILVIVYNNQCYFAVKRATRALHPEGWAVKTNHFPLSELPVTAHYEKVCEAFGGYGERVEDPEQVGPAIERALHVVRQEKRQALLNIICKHP
jgi:acetolactate synthase-1/2/3 large subunit